MRPKLYDPCELIFAFRGVKMNAMSGGSLSILHYGYKLSWRSLVKKIAALGAKVNLQEVKNSQKRPSLFFIDKNIQTEKSSSTHVCGRFQTNQGIFFISS